MEAGALSVAASQPRALNLIDGQWRSGAAQRWGDSINPASAQEIGSYAASNKADAQEAIAAARRAFERHDWSDNPVLREALLLQWADRLAGRTDLAHLLTRENGKVLEQSRREIACAIAELRRYAALARRCPGSRRAGPGGRADVLVEAAGVVGLIVPWNMPVGALIGSLAPALAAGCTAVVKPAPQSTQVSAAVIGELHALAALPKGVVNLVSESGHEVARELAASASVDVLGFTGSHESGRKIALAAAPSMKKMVLALRGKACCLVFDDVDIGRVASRLAGAATVVSGQQCSAARRVLVHASRYEEMKQALKHALGQIVVGAGDAPDSGMGPLIDAAALVSVGVRTEQALDSCDEVLLRGRRPGGGLKNGFFVSPTLVAQRDCTGFAFQEDIFGPFVVLGTFGDDSEAVANACKGGACKTVSVWTGNPRRATRVARALRNATVWINQDASAETPDGLVRPGGPDGMADFLRTRHIFRS